MEVKTENFKFFQNKECEYFPCHKVSDESKFSCMFCYCPLYFLDNCGGNCKYLESGVKDCTNCTIPHFDYQYIVDRVSLEIKDRNNIQ